jgi:endonuclease/exonuclease/phosphatase family metal-dependent hydrolase
MRFLWATGRLIRWVVVAVAWLVLLGVAGLVVVRLLGLDGHWHLFLPLSGLPLVGAGTLVLLVLLVVLRAGWAASVALLLVVVLSLFVLPRVIPDGTDVPAGAPRLRIASVNLFRGQVDATAVVDLVRRWQIQVLAVQELTPEGLARLDAAGLGEVLPYRVLAAPDSNLFSALPLSAPADGWPKGVATVRVGDRMVGLLAVHTVYPVGSVPGWEASFERLRRDLETAPPDLVVFGDFNASLDHAPMRRLMRSAGLTDSHAELGHWAPTWPVWNRPVPPLVQLDHVLHGPGIAAVELHERYVPGTDHKLIEADLAVLGR